MASIVAYVEVRDGFISPPSRYTVAEARRIADAAGATVYAFLQLGPLSQVEIDQLAAQVSAAGADRILCASHANLAGPPLEVTHGPLLAHIVDRLRPILLLFPAGGVGTALGCPLAVRIGAAFAANATIGLRFEERSPGPPSHRVVLSRWRGAGDGLRELDLGDMERPIVATLAAGVAHMPLGESSAEVEMLPCREPSSPLLPRRIDSIEDPEHDLETASTVIWVQDPAAVEVLTALRAEMPPGSALAHQGNEATGAFQAMSPSTLIVVRSSSGSASQVAPPLAPQTEVTYLGAPPSTHGPALATKLWVCETTSPVEDLAHAMKIVRAGLTENGT